MPMPFAPPIRKQLEKLPRTSATWQLGQSEAQLALGDGTDAVVLLCVQADGHVRAAKVTAIPAGEAD